MRFAGIAGWSAAFVLAGSPSLAAQRHQLFAPSGIRADSAREPLPSGFVAEQTFIGIRAGGIGAGIGLVVGLVASKIAAESDPNQDDLGLIAYPIAGGLLGYIVGAPVGVHRFSTRQGIRAPFIAALSGATIGAIVGAPLAGVGWIVTVPLGAALMHDAVRK